MAGPHLLIVESPYYEHIAKGLADGAIAAIEKAGGTWDRMSVPGALEVPGAIAMAEAAVAVPMTAMSRWAASSAARRCITRSSPTNPHAG